jgi:crossover junction endodeoxyribonuclease RuvC
MVNDTQNKKSEIILGVDPGFALLGYGVIEKDSAGNLRLIDYGVVSTHAKMPFATRLKEIHEGLEDVIKKYKPDVMAVEDLFFYKNVKTAIEVGQARGVIILTGIQAGLPIEEYTPLQIKQAVTSYGRADKNQVQQMVKMLLKLKEIPKPDDAADGLAVAICCANSSNKLK